MCKCPIYNEYFTQKIQDLDINFLTPPNKLSTTEVLFFGNGGGGSISSSVSFISSLVSPILCENSGIGEGKDNSSSCGIMKSGKSKVTSCASMSWPSCSTSSAIFLSSTLGISSFNSSSEIRRFNSSA